MRKESRLIYDNLYMTADEAAAALGVSTSTLYAYVTRKGIRTQKITGGRGSRYWREDVERAKGRSPLQSPRSDGGSLVSETTITAITKRGPLYRGQSALALSETATLETVAALLWRAPEEVVFPMSAPATLQDVTTIWPLLGEASAIDKACALFPMIEDSSLRAYDLSQVGYARTGGELMRWFAALMAGSCIPTAEPLHIVVARNSDDPAIYSDLARRLMVLAADHELDPTTYSVRAIANTGATPYRVVLGGFSASLGRRTAFGRAESMDRLIEEIVTSPRPKDAIQARIRDGDTLPGFASDRYPEGDPRAMALLTAMRRALDGDIELSRLGSAIEVVREATSREPDFSLVNMFLARRLNPKHRRSSIALRLGRIAGWIAHAMEQYHTTPLVRPRAAYTGLLPPD